MATVSFHLRNQKADEPTPIFMLLYSDGKQTKVKTGLRILPNLWDTAGQKAKTRGKGIPAAANGLLNDDLVGMGERAVAFYAQQRKLGALPTGADVWEAIKPAVVEDAAPAPAPDQPAPLPDFAAYIEHIRPKSGESTLRAKKVTLGHLTRFSEIYLPGRALAYSDFTRAFKDAFAGYLANTVRLADNTLAKQLTILKGFLGFAADHNRTSRIEVRGWGWKYKEPDIISLTAAELAAIEALVGLPSYLENARKLFLLMCLTGLRYSDAMRLKPEHDKGDHLHLITRKTKDGVEVYIRKALRPILDAYWAGELRLITNQKLNEYIKELGERAGIDSPIEITRYYGQTSQPVQEIHPKYKLLSCHSGRRSFVTLSIGRNIAADVVMQATGHKNFKTLQRYNQTTAQRQVEASRKAWGEDDE